MKAYGIALKNTIYVELKNTVFLKYINFKASRFVSQPFDEKPTLVSSCDDKKHFGRFQCLFGKSRAAKAKAQKKPRRHRHVY